MFAENRLIFGLFHQKKIFQWVMGGGGGGLENYLKK